MQRWRSSPGRDARIAAERGGRFAESLAALYLRLKLYRVLARRFKTPVGEVDLIASRFGTTAFVEIKVRRRRGVELETLEGVNTRRIARAARYYLARHPALAMTPLRFDVIFLAPWSWPRHVVNAFEDQD
jgi:putative endonuclease